MSSEPEPSEEAEEPAPKKTSLIVHIAVFLLVTGMAAGAGFGVSMFMKPDKSEMSAEMGDDKAKEEDEQAQKLDEFGDPIVEKEESEEEEKVQKAYAKPLAPILTNLAAPEDVWVRMELAVVGKTDLSDELLEQIHQDLFAYMRTVKLHHVEGASGYINLRAELNERAVVRSGGAAKMVLVRTLVFE